MIKRGPCSRSMYVQGQRREINSFRGGWWHHSGRVYWRVWWLSWVLKDQVFVQCRQSRKTASWAEGTQGQRLEAWCALRCTGHSETFQSSGSEGLYKLVIFLQENCPYFLFWGTDYRPLRRPQRETHWWQLSLWRVSVVLVLANGCLESN